MPATNRQGREPIAPTSSLLNVPNSLSVARAIAGPVVLALITTGTDTALYSALGLMILAELSDLADGEIARRYDQETEIGRFADPVCDSVYHLSVFLAFLTMGWMPAWMVFVLYGRELVVPYLRTFARQAGHDLQVRASGKTKAAVHAVVQISIVAIALGLFGPQVTIGGVVPTILLLAAIAASIYSLADYVAAVYRLVRS
jgi:CDP-diacylglycerol--glycerol-3-phosphate 3-phosphatidyltransferase